MPVANIENLDDLVNAVATLVERAYGAPDELLRYNPSEKNTADPTGLPAELPIVYDEWQDVFDLPELVDLCRSERDTHLVTLDNPNFPHCIMVDIKDAQPDRFVSGATIHDYLVTIKLGLFYGHYRAGSARKFRANLVRLMSYFEDNNADLGLTEGGGLIEASPLIFNRADLADFQSMRMHVALADLSVKVQF